MSTKKFTRILVLILVFVLSFSVCSCTEVESVTRDVPRIIELTTEISEISQLTDPEEIETRTENLFHPKSGLTYDMVMEKIWSDEAFEGIDLEAASAQGVTIGNFSDAKLKLNDSQLGGNIYEITADVTVGEYVFNVTLYLLSDETMLGLYDFDIENSQ